MLVTANLSKGGVYMTAPQMRYLLTYMGLNVSERSITSVAIELSVNKSTVSRVFALAVKEGILDEKHQITAYGKQEIEQFSFKLEKLIGFLCDLGLNRKSAYQEAYQMLGACSEETIQALIKRIQGVA